MKNTDLIGMIRLFNEQNIQYISGVTQRYFEWDKRNIIQYLQGIQYIDIPQKRPYLINSTVTKQMDFNPQFRVISITDGQQRMTTTYLDICAICAFAKNNGIPKNEFDYEAIKQTYLVNPIHEGDDYYYKLLLREEDRPTLKMIVDELPSHLSSRAGRNKIINAYNRLYDSLTIDNYQERFDKLFYVYALNIIAEENDDEYLIFNMINSGGKQVGLFTLAKAHSIGKFPLKQQELYDKLYWKKIEKNETFKHTIIRTFVVYKKGYIESGDAYNLFQKVFNKYNDVEEFHIELKEYSDTFLDILNNSFEDKHIKEVMDGLRLIIPPARYPLLIKLYLKHQKDEITKQELLNSLELLLNIGLRKYFVSHKAWMSESRNMLENNISYIDNCEDICKALYNKLKNSIITDSEFENRICTNIFYSPQNKKEFKQELEVIPNNINKLTKYLLLRIENAHFGAGRINPSHFSIEHNCPQKLNKNWAANFTKEEHHDYVHMLGNLTLLAKEHNSKAKGAGFKSKKELYIFDKLYLGRTICSYDDWTPETILNRTRSLAKELCEIFKIPSKELLREYETSQSVLMEGK